MNVEEAVHNLRLRFEAHEEALICENGPGQLAEDLVEWFNATEIDEDNLAALFLLAIRQQFQSWGCPVCGERVFEGQPDDWGNFQGALQNDRTSFPGHGPDDRRCDHCRCYMLGEGYCGREHA